LKLCMSETELILKIKIQLRTLLNRLKDWGLRLGVIIFCLVRFLSKKVTKLKLFFFEKKTKTEPKPGQTDRFRFGFFRAKTGSNRFGSVFPVLAWFSRFWLGFFRFGSVFPVWLGFFLVFCRFWFGSVFLVFCL